MRNVLLFIGVMLCVLSASAQVTPEAVGVTSHRNVDDSMDISLPLPKHEAWVLKTNLLYDLVLSPSVEAEYRFNPHWSMHADFAIAWWSRKSKHEYYQLLQFSPEVRYWLNPKKYWKGHYVGAFVGAGYYDLEHGERGYKGEYLMAGFSYGYMYPINQSLSLDLGIGVGYLNTEYEEYLPIEGHYVYQQKSRTGYVGPLKVRLALVWHLGRKLAKGGRR